MEMLQEMEVNEDEGKPTWVALLLSLWAAEY